MNYENPLKNASRKEIIDFHLMMFFKMKYKEIRKKDFLLRLHFWKVNKIYPIKFIHQWKKILKLNYKEQNQIFTEFNELQDALIQASPFELLFEKYDKIWQEKNSPEGLRKSEQDKQEHLKAVVEKQARDEDIRQFHAYVIDLIEKSPEGKQIRERAKIRVASWTGECRPNLQEEWSKILNMSAMDMRNILVAKHPLGNELRQNSPFWYLYNDWKLVK